MAFFISFIAGFACCMIIVGWVNLFGQCKHKWHVKKRGLIVQKYDDGEIEREVYTIEKCIHCGETQAFIATDSNRKEVDLSYAKVTLGIKETPDKLVEMEE